MANAGAAVHELEHGIAGRPSRLAIATSLFAFAVSYFRAFAFPDTSFGLWGDYVGFFNDGSRIVAGQIPYRDYFKVVTPGTDLLFALLIKIFGLRLWIPPLVMAVVATACALLMTLIAARILRGAYVMMPALLFVGYGLIYSNDATHHWFSSLFVMLAVVVLLHGPTSRNVILAGVCCGLATCFTQTRGVLSVLAFAVYLLQNPLAGSVAERWRKCLLLCLSMAVLFFAFNLYFIEAAGLRQWLFCLVEYPARFYPAPPINNWRVLTFEFGEHGELTKWVAFPFLYLSLPLTYVGVFLLARRKWNRDDERWQQVLLVAIAGLAMFLAIISAPSAKRMSIASPMAMILLAWLLAQPSRFAPVVKFALAASALALAILLPARAQLHHHIYIELPAGRVALTDPALYDEYQWLSEHTHPGQYFFGMAPLYFSFHMPNAAPIEGYHPSEYTRPEQVAALVQAIEAHQVPMIILRWSPEFLKSNGSPSDHLGPFRTYLVSHYHVTKSFRTGDDVWERNSPGTSDSPLVK